MKNHIIVDIDGTVSDTTHRLHHILNKPKNWDAFFAGCVDDAPHNDIISLLRFCAISLTTKFHYVSGRSDSVRLETLAWLKEYGCPRGELYMRKHGDHREDYVVKEEILDTDLKLTPDDVWFILDDRNQVVNMWRKRGFRVLQVADGNF